MDLKQKQYLSSLYKGKKRSAESVAKSIATKKLNGFHHSKETKEKMSLAALGKVRSAQHAANISISLKGIKLSEEHKLKIRLGLLGESHAKYILSEESLKSRSEKLSKNLKLRWSDPEKAAKLSIGIKKAKKKQWEGHIRKDPRRMAEQSDWRKEVFTRDNYTCQRCFKHGGNLHAHHIKSWVDFPELRNELSNGKTLCANPCHGDEHKKLGTPVGFLPTSEGKEWDANV